MNWNNLDKIKVKEIIGNLLFLLLFIFLPLIINLVIALFPQGDRWNAVSSKIIPGEILAYGLGLIAPVFVLIVKSHGKGYKIPALKTVFGLSITLYITILLLVFIAKNGLIAGIDYNPSRGLYFWFSIATLIISLGLRTFTDIQNECFSDFKQERENQQDEFNKGFINSLQ